MKRIPVLPIVGLLMVLMIAVAGCSTNLSRKFYQHYPRSIADVERDWGEPVKVTMLENGIEKRVYPIQSPYTDLKYRYFLFRHNMVLASGITDIGKAAPADVPQPSVDFKPSDLSKIFYAENRTTVAHIDSTWGEPVNVKDMPDGTQVRVYAIKDPYTDFKYRKFIVKDGIVVASRISPEIGGVTPPSGKPGTCCIEINEISNLYYRNHPMSLNELKQNWGEPVLIEKDENGLEKWVYKLKIPVDAGFSFRFFVIDDGHVVSSGVRDTLDISDN